MERLSPLSRERSEWDEGRGERVLRTSRIVEGPSTAR
jgi:hypothetical protein